MTTTQLQAGAIIAGRFKLDRELGRGGMGSVWVATQLALDTPCAVKFIETEVANKAPGARERFEREAKAAAQLRSPHVVQILDYGMWEDQPYIAMELLVGESLAERLVRSGQLSRSETLAVMRQVARALTKAHAVGIVHRDLKPENIFLVHDDDRDVVKVLDFGIAKTMGGANFTRTATGQLLGTPYYMSPEQANGTLPVDFRSDLWSLGVIAFECLVGAPPFESEALGDLLNRIMNKPPPVPSSVAPNLPPSFDRWFARACSRPPGERFQSAKELARELADALGLADEPMGETPDGSTSEPRAARALALQTTTPSWDKTVEAGPAYAGAPGEQRTFAGQTRSSGNLAPPGRLRRALVFATVATALVALVAAIAARSEDADDVPIASTPAASADAVPAASPAPTSNDEEPVSTTPQSSASTRPTSPAPVSLKTVAPRSSSSAPSPSVSASAAPANSGPDPGF